jgi:predicted nucleotidyltransferase
VNGIEAVLRQAAHHLDAGKARWALIGGLAISVWTEPRFTRDVDIAVAVANDDDAESLTRRFLAVGYEVVASVEQEVVGRLATVRLRPMDAGDGDPVLDLLFASSGIEHEIVADADIVEVVPGLELPVARAGHLVALKLLSEADSRPQDAADLAAIRQHLSSEELERARGAVRLIAERGYNRGRDLVEDLASWARGR